MIQILLSSYNGEKFIQEQINSLIKQKGVEFDILVRDDGSIDGTQAILERLQEEGCIKWYTGDNLKPANSFMNLLRNSDERDYYAFCDQDDIWLEDKLRVATDVLKCYPQDKPALYFSAKRLVDSDLNVIKDDSEKPLLTKEEAFIYNPVTGCTLVINKALRDIVLSASMDTISSLHDSWIYRICLIIGGNVFFDSEPHILYRQHGNNVVGHVGPWGRIKAFSKEIWYNDGARSKVANDILQYYSLFIDDNNKFFLEQIARYKKDFKAKVSLFFNKNMRTSSWMGAFTFRLYLLLNKY